MPNNGPRAWGLANGFPYDVTLIDKTEEHMRDAAIWLGERRFEYRSWTFRDLPSIIIFKHEKEAIEFRLNFG
jgi:hypothetical protein